MIPVEYYKPVYFILLTLLLVVIFLPDYLRKTINAVKSTPKKFVLIALLAITIAFIGLRATNASPEYLGDTIQYTRVYESVKYGYRTEFTKDYGFYYFMKLSTKIFDVRWFYVICALIYILLPYFTLKKWFRDYAVYALIVYITAFSFLPFGINGLRNGLASAIFIFGLGFANKKWLMYGLFVLSVTFHKGMLLPLFAFVLTNFIKSPKKLLLFWIASIPISLLIGENIESIVLSIFSSQSFIQDERALTYFLEKSSIEKVAGQFRIDFILYSAVAVFVGYWGVLKKGLENQLYRQIWSLYVISNAIWILLIYAPYTNRIAYLSWFIMPVVLVAPFISDVKFSIKNKKTKLLYVMYGSLAFTLIMELL